jgi:hypothetical protein
LLYDGAPLVVVIRMREAGPGGPIGLEAGRRGGPRTKSWLARGTTYAGLCAAGFREALRQADPSMGSYTGKRPGSTVEALAPLHISLAKAPVARQYTYGLLGAAGGFITVGGAMAWGGDVSLGVGHVAHHFIGGARLGLFAGTTGFGTTTLLFRASADLGAQLGRWSIVLEPGLGSFARINGIYGSTNFALGLEGKVGVDLGRWRRNAGAIGLYARGGGFLSVNGAGIYEASLGIEVRP